MYDLSELMDRLVAMQKEAVQGCDNSADWNHTQEAFPYWINRIASMIPDPTAELQPIDRYTVIMRFVIGHFTANYKGLEVEIAHQAIPVTLSYFRGFDSESLPKYVPRRITGNNELEDPPVEPFKTI